MTVLQEIILWDKTELTCENCRQQYKEDGNKIPPCYNPGGKCALTKQPITILSYDEQLLLDEIMDYLHTKEILNKDADHRKTIIELSNYALYLMKQKQEKE